MQVRVPDVFAAARRLLVVVALLVPFLVGTREARPFFILDGTVLRAEIQTLHDSYVEPLTNKQRKEKAFLAKVLKTLDKEITTIYADLLAVAKIAKFLNKVKAIVPPDIGDKVRDLTVQAVPRMNDILDSLEFRVAALPPSAAKTKAEKALPKIRAFIADAANETSVIQLANALADSMLDIAILRVAVKKAEDKAGI